MKMQLDQSTYLLLLLMKTFAIAKGQGIVIAMYIPAT